jgi:hypothetical protein
VRAAPEVRTAGLPRRFVAGLAIALAAGIAIGWMDSRPGWDDTAITVVSLLVAAAAAAFVTRRVPWLVAILAGMWVPLFELPGLASGGALAALVFSGIGASIGWLAARR